MLKKLPFGIKLFGALLIFSSLIQMAGFEYNRYRHIWFRQLPEEVVFLRFLFSWMLRLAGLACGIGILKQKDIFRKIALGLFSFTIITIYWKHPYFVFKNIADSSVKRILDSPAFAYSLRVQAAEILTSFLDVAVVFVYAGEILFALCFIYYFTRPQVKQWFTK